MSKHKSPRGRRSHAAWVSVLGLAAGSLMLAALPANADHGPSPSDDAAACAAAGGTFTDHGDGLTECVVVDVETEQVAASHSNQAWTAEITTTTTTTFETLVVEIPPVVELRCVNPGGNVVGPWSPEAPEEGNPNCVEAYQAGGQQPGPPEFRIAEVVIEEGSIEITHDESTTVESEQTGCRNHNGNVINDWESNPHCVPAAPLN